MDIIFLIIILLIFIGPMLLLSRQQRKRQNEVVELQQGLQPGDDVITAGGVHGRVVTRTDTTVWLEIADGVVVEFELNVVARKDAPDAPAPGTPIPGTAGATMGGEPEAPESLQGYDLDDYGPIHPENDSQDPKDEK